MADSCLLLACQDGTTSLVHLATRALLASYKENTCTLRGVVAPAPVHALNGVQSGDVFIAVQHGRPAINIFSWSRDAAVFKCAMAEALTCLAVSPDGTFTFAGSASGKLYVWDTLSGELLRVLQTHYKACTALCVSPCGGFLACGGADALVHVLDVSTLVDAVGLSDPATQPRPLATFSGHSLPITALLFAARSSGVPRVVSCSLDQCVRWWDVSGRREIASATLPTGVACMALHPDEDRLYAGCIDGLVYVVSVAAVLAHACGGEVGTYLQPHAATGALAQRGGDATTAAAAAMGATTPALLGHTGVLTAVCVSVDGSVIVSAGEDGSVRTWDAASRLCTGMLDGTPTKSPVMALALLPYKPAGFTSSGGRGKDAHREGGGGSVGGTSGSNTGVGLPLFAPLKKHIQPISVDWRGSVTGPSDRDGVLALVSSCGPSAYGRGGGLALRGLVPPHTVDPTATAHEVMRKQLDALEGALLAVAYSTGVAASSAGPAAAHVAPSVLQHATGQTEAEVQALRTRVALLEDENVRWKSVNNKLAARLQAGGPG